MSGLQWNLDRCLLEKPKLEKSDEVSIIHPTRDQLSFPSEQA
jgi:hypothetical protein